MEDLSLCPQLFKKHGRVGSEYPGCQVLAWETSMAGSLLPVFCIQTTPWGKRKHISVLYCPVFPPMAPTGPLKFSALWSPILFEKKKKKGFQIQILRSDLMLEKSGKQTAFY